MEGSDKLNSLYLCLKNYYNYLHECDKNWIEASQKAREKERDLLVLSDQLQSLLRENQTKLNPLELQKTADRITLILEENFTSLSTVVESVLNSDDELLHLRQEVENHYEPIENDILQRLMKNVHVSWLFYQTRSSSVSIALKNVNYKSPESIKQLLQNISGTDDLRNELTETLEVAENLMRNFELYM